MIEVENVSKLYPNEKGVSEISFSLKKGEILGLLGPNGAGKTTTMRIITGYLYPSGGSVRVGGYDLFEQPLAVRRQIGYLPEIPPLYPEMNVQGYLEFVAGLKGVPKQAVAKETARVVEITGLGDVRFQLIGSLSKGYKQRTGLAQALLNSPPVLILDEPTVGLDPKQIIEIRNLIKSLAQEHTVILSSHILPEVNMICERVIIMDQGRLVAMDTPEGLSHQINKGQRVEIEVRGEREAITGLLQSIPELNDWSYGGEVKNPWGTEAQPNHKYIVTSQSPSDLRARLFSAFAQAKLTILEMRSANLSLEEIFLRLTTQEHVEEGQAPGQAEERPEASAAGAERSSKGGNGE
ncbi:MAG TPA: ATP-binding cassette domain-containing protein [Firmicutes bacterium]|nr:ATP-binding cassette domain-containing protein [Bacillota bacterium]